MTEQSQQEYLKAAKAALDVEWDALADMAGIKPRALKTYRMPATSKDHRALPDLARRQLMGCWPPTKKDSKGIKKPLDAVRNAYHTKATETNITEG